MVLLLDFEMGGCVVIWYCCWILRWTCWYVVLLVFEMDGCVVIWHCCWILR
jgi:hypothetical protein